MGFAVFRLLSMLKARVTNGCVFFPLTETKHYSFHVLSAIKRFILKDTNMNCLYSDKKHQGSTFILFLNAVCLKFLNEEYIL